MHSRRLALLLVMLSSSQLLTACTRTVTKEVRVPVPTPVVVRSVCPVSLPPVPARPHVADPVVCAKAFGAGSVCYDPIDAVKLGVLLQTLSGVYVDRKACDVPAP